MLPCDRLTPVALIEAPQTGDPPWGGVLATIGRQFQPIIRPLALNLFQRRLEGLNSIFQAVRARARHSQSADPRLLFVRL